MDDVSPLVAAMLKLNEWSEAKDTCVDLFVPFQNVCLPVNSCVIRLVNNGNGSAVSGNDHNV